MITQREHIYQHIFLSINNIMAEFHTYQIFETVEIWVEKLCSIRI